MKGLRTANRNIISEFESTAENLENIKLSEYDTISD